MPDFIIDWTTESGSLSFPKIDAVSPPVGSNPDNFVASENWNALNQAVTDLRHGILSGSLFGFGTRFASPGDTGLPTIPGFDKVAGDYVYVNTDGALVQHKKDNSEFVLAAAAANTRYVQLAELDTLAIPIILPALQQGSAIFYLRSNGQTIPGMRRTQLVARWGTNNSDTVIAEGPEY
jgi:hypothetical protein